VSLDAVTGLLPELKQWAAALWGLLSLVGLALALWSLQVFLMSALEEEDASDVLPILAVAALLMGVGFAPVHFVGAYEQFRAVASVATGLTGALGGLGLAYVVLGAVVAGERLAPQNAAEAVMEISIVGAVVGLLLSSVWLWPAATTAKPGPSAQASPKAGPVELSPAEKRAFVKAWEARVRGKEAQLWEGVDRVPVVVEEEEVERKTR